MARTIWVVDDLRVDPGARSVTRDGEEIALPRLSFELLVALIETAPDAVSGDELMERVWRGAVVSPATIAKRVELLRSALGDDRPAPRYIDLVRGYGYRLVPDPRREFDAAATDGDGSDRQRWPAAFALGALTMVIVAGLALVRTAPDPEPEAPEDTIAVLPFRSLGEDPEDQQFADGLTEEIAHSLARTGSLRVAGRLSSFRFRDSDRSPREIGDTLGVAHLLEGSVRRSGDRLRVVARLVDTRDGLQRWAESWDRSMRDVVTVQRQISKQVADQLQVELTPDGGRLGAPTTDNAEAYTLYLMAKSLSPYPVGGELAEAQRLIEQVVELDPEFSHGWSRLAAIHGRRLFVRDPDYPHSPPEAIAIVRAAIDRALALDPRNGNAFAALAGLAWAFEQDTERTARLIERAVERDPWDLDILTFAADFAKSLGLLEQARALESYVLQRDPLCAYCQWQHLFTLQMLGDHPEAVRVAKLIGRTDPDSPAAALALAETLLWAGEAREARVVFETLSDPADRLAGLAMSSRALGDTARAERLWAEATAEWPAEPAGRFYPARASAFMDKREQALDYLDALTNPKPGAGQFTLQLQYLLPPYDSLRETPQWGRLLERIGRSPEQIREIDFDVTRFVDLQS